MIIDQLTLQQFGVFSGRQSISFASGSARQPMTLVSALNGSGKTTLLEALRLALYGRRILPSKVSYEEYLGALIHREAASGETSSVEVIFRMRTEGQEKRFRVTRSWQRVGDGVRECLEVAIDDRVDEDFIASWPDMIEQLLPLRLSAFCFFDGEKLEDLADTDRSRDVVREAVSTLLGLDLVSQLAIDLRTVEKRTRARLVAEGTHPQLDELNTRHEEADDLVQQALHDRGIAANVLERAKLDLLVTEDSYRASGGELHESRRVLEDAHSAAENELRTVEERLIVQAQGLAPILLLRNLICGGDDVGTSASLASSALLILAERDRQLLDEAAALGVGPDFVKAIGRYLAEDRKRRSGKSKGSEKPVSMQFIESQLGEVAGELRATLTEVQRSQLRMDGTLRSLERIPQEAAVAIIQKQRDDAKVAQLQAEANLRIADEALTAARLRRTKIIDAYSAEVERRLVEGGRSDEARQMSERTKAFGAALVVFQQTMARRHAGRLAALIGDSLGQLHRKNGLIHTVDVDPETFEVMLRDSKGRDLSPGRLSAGERQILAIATIWAILRASGRPLPLVIDTPLGRLDSEHRELLTQRFFANASHQVILLATDTEIDDHMYQRLRPRISKAYTITYDGATAGSHIVPGFIGEQAA